MVCLFAARDGDPRDFPAPGLPELRLQGLDPEAAAALLAGTGLDSRRTIDHHLRNVFVKLGVSSRAELIRLQLADR